MEKEKVLENEIKSISIEELANLIMILKEGE